MTDESLFDLLLAADVNGREELLNRETEADPARRERLRAMVAAVERRSANEATQSFGDDEAKPSTVAMPDVKEHTVIAGKYRLIEPIGEGGMGSVWLAQQTEPVKRKVAIKLIKAGMDSKQVLARFEAERQALAMMDHPNIAKVLDGGLHENRPFFVMELVKGVPITEYCDHHKLTPKQRLELFVPVCQAIQHAHQKGIIHRDIKPSNVLIAPYDDRPVPKVIDFGVAKATGEPLTEKTLITGLGGLVGTPQYMSPEQATFNNLDIDTRSDVYALGVLLYELLTGNPPISSKVLQKKGLLEILRLVREIEPTRPSTKLSNDEDLSNLSANLSTEPKVLIGVLMNELDWIVLKALEKDRLRRYETANDFAADINRFLNGEAVLAHPPSKVYQIMKFNHRNKFSVSTVGSALFLLIVAFALTLMALKEAERQEGNAKSSASLARKEEQKVREEKLKTQAAQEAAELNLVNSFLRPIGHDNMRIDDVEWNALEELEQQDNSNVKILFIKVILDNDSIAFRCLKRVQVISKATVGLSQIRRSKIIELCIRCYKNYDLRINQREFAFLLARELGHNDVFLKNDIANNELIEAQVLSSSLDISKNILPDRSVVYTGDEIFETINKINNNRVRIDLLLEYIKSMSSNRKIDTRWIYPLLRYCETVEDVTNALKYVRAAGDFQNAFLLRLEQVAFPYPEKTIALVGLGNLPYGTLLAATYEQAEHDIRFQNRRFRTIADASKWLAENHPTIDLEAPYQAFNPYK